MDDDLDFSKAADREMQRLFAALVELDPDEVDADLATGVLTMEFADGRKCILNRQSAAHQIWLAEGATAWHFALEGERWLDTKGRGELRSVLAQVLDAKLGHPVQL